MTLRKTQSGTGQSPLDEHGPSPLKQHAEETLGSYVKWLPLFSQENHFELRSCGRMKNDFNPN